MYHLPCFNLRLSEKMIELDKYLEPFRVQISSYPETQGSPLLDLRLALLQRIKVLFCCCSKLIPESLVEIF